MAPSRKSRSVKRVSYVSEIASNKDGENNKRSGPRKKKLSDMLGPQWSKEELERFYEAYRKYGKDWKKVAAAVRNRSVEMVEALYTMNRAYLSLPEGTASVVGLIAMMTDHYCVLGGTDSEQESNEKSRASQKPLKQNRGKLRVQSSKKLEEPHPDLLQFQSSASKYGCLSLLKKRRSGETSVFAGWSQQSTICFFGSRPHAVGKRTPRIPISCTYEKSKSYLSPLSQGLKLKVDAVDDNVAHEVALALTEASQKGGSPQISRTPNRKAETPSPAQNNDRMRTESEMTSAKFHDSEMDEYGHEISLGSTEADNGDHSGGRNYLMNIERTGVLEAPSKRRRYHKKKPLEVEESVTHHLEETKEACSGTEGETLHDLKGSFEVDIADATTSRTSTKGRKRSTKVLFGVGEETSFDALQTLADLSLMMPETTADTESSTQLKEEESQVVQKPKMKGISSLPGVKVAASKSSKRGTLFGPTVSDTPQTREKSHQVDSGTRKKRQKPSPSKVLKDDINVDSSLDGLPKIELQNKGKRSDDAAHLNQGKLRRALEHTSLSTDFRKESSDSVPPTLKVPSVNNVSLPTKVRSKRKVGVKKLVTDKNLKSANDVDSKSDVPNSLSHGRTFDSKGKLSNFLSQYQARRWCSYEWFYSSIDYPWFAKREFVEYLDHVGLGHIPRLTRVEWGVIRSSLGKPRRFSDQFLKEEKEKLNQYRESVRTHYAELRAGTREGLPTDLARPLSVGQRVVAIHPKDREVQNGSVLTIDHSRYRIQFDGPELGMEFVMDIDCMPLNPLERMPASFVRQNFAFSKFIENFNDIKMNVQHKESKMEEHVKLALYENAISPTRISPSTYHISNMVQQAKIDSSPISQLKVPSESAYTQQMLNSQPPILAQSQAREADIHALSDLTRALDKKEALVSELRSMNDEVMENQNGGDKSLKDTDSFKKQYAAVLLQLNEVNEQVSSALFSLRQRNTYHGSFSHMWLKAMPNSGERGGHSSPFDHSTYQSLESKSNVSEIVESSRVKAQGMVDAAVEAMSSFKKEGKSKDTIEEAIDFINNQLSVDDLNVSAARPPLQKDSVHGAPALHDQTTTRTSNLTATSDANDSKSEMSHRNEAQIPSDLIAHCVATLLMIQRCTERQFPPGDVAQVLDSAVTNLQPFCSQNLPLYAEIQKCMGIIRNQILALVPT